MSTNEITVEALPEEATMLEINNQPLVVCRTSIDNRGLFTDMKPIIKLRAVPSMRVYEHLAQEYSSQVVASECDTIEANPP